MKRNPFRGEQLSGALWDVAIDLMIMKEGCDFQTAFALVKGRVRFRLRERTRLDKATRRK